MRRELTFIHFAVVLFGLSGLFAKIVSLHAVHIVLGRVFFASIFLYLLLLLLKVPLTFQNNKVYFYFFMIGAVLALHWGSFFYAIQLSTVAVGLVTFATFPIFASFLEPLFLKERFQRSSFILAISTLIGVIIIIPEFSFSDEITTGVIWGLISAITFAILSILNRAFVKDYNSIVIGFYQNFFAFIILFPILFIYPVHVQLKDGALLFLLGVVFTAGAHVLYIRGLGKVNVRTASIIASLEPVYGIAAAALLLAEFPEGEQWIGILLILVAVIYATFKK